MQIPRAFEVQVLESWVLVTVGQAATMRQMLVGIEQSGARMSGKRLLIDARDAAETTGAMHAILAEHLAQHMRGVPRIAIVARESEITYNSERVADRRGLTLRVFSSMDEAESWLRSGRQG